MATEPTLRRVLLVASALAFVGCDGGVDPTEIEALGDALFHDTNLSANRTQACASCHDPERAFVDARVGADGEVRPVSLGDDGASFGDRNAPSAAYAAFVVPAELSVGTRVRHNRHENNRTYDGPRGGLFHDGRAAGLEGQAGGPPLNPIEMGMESPSAVVQRLLEDPYYDETFRRWLGDDVFEDPDVAYGAMTDAIAAYERTDVFASFDSKYDRVLRGEAEYSFMELTGRALFFSEFTNCAICHQLHDTSDPVNRTRETFSGYEFHNIGVPVNEQARALSGVTEPDLGLAGVAGFEGPANRGRFRTPTLRNIAVTGPYMHNGAFRSLRTTIEFYLHFVDPEGHPDNPETGAPWREPEIPETVATELLRVGRPLTELEIDSLVCFLRTFTDQRYEALVEEDGISCAD